MGIKSFSADNKNYREIGNQESDMSLIFDAERIFENIFSEEVFPMENNPNYIRTYSVSSLSCSVSDSKVCFVFYQQKKNQIH